ncbi:glutathione-dependent formaldehyde-activating enzyme family protein [Lysobacter antibioticus]|uniref:GFA family protein n=1 Tax=Lysobacter antibioticus TaxID=84531 RepID=UPI0007172ED9|nr:GFA family protein [Lysobacter antibioticus]ALN63734.1 glutathione-dependent formaldehyde-activating enzyme family protein [Lysobacter antibioticus]
MSDTHFEGGCLCGAVRYRATSAPLRGVICHCGLCRRHSGAPALAFVHFPADAFAWLASPPSWYRSSEHAERGFCGVCGSTIGMRESVLADRVQVCIGSLDEPERAGIDDHVWTGSQLPWFEVADALPRFTRSSTAVPSKA